MKVPFGPPHEVGEYGLPLAPLGERVIVVGAGIAGLTAAFRLRQAGFDVQVLEASDHVGGRMATIEHAGYRLDVAAGIVSTAYREMGQLIHDVGLGAECKTTATEVGVVSGGEIHRFNKKSGIANLRSPVLSARGKIGVAQIAMDSLRLRRSLSYQDYTKSAALDTETAWEYGMRRGGQEVLEHVIEPACQAWYYTGPENLSKVAFLWHLSNFWGGSFFNWTKGIGVLPEALARNVAVALNARVSGVEERANGVRVSWEDGDGAQHVEDASAAVIALSAHTMLNVYPQLDPTRRDIVEKLDYTRSLHVYLGLSRLPPESSFCVLVPKQRHEGLLGVAFEHHKGGRAPAGKALLSVWFRPAWHDAYWDFDDEKVLLDATAAVDEVFPGLAGGAEMTYVHRISPCFLKGSPGLYGALARFAAASDTSSRIQLAGDYLPVTSTNASLSSGELAAQNVARRFGTRTTRNR